MTKEKYAYMGWPRARPKGKGAFLIKPRYIMAIIVACRVDGLTKSSWLVQFVPVWLTLGIMALVLITALCTGLLALSMQGEANAASRRRPTRDIMFGACHRRLLLPRRLSCRHPRHHPCIHLHMRGHEAATACPWAIDGVRNDRVEPASGINDCVLLQDAEPVSAPTQLLCRGHCATRDFVEACGQILALTDGVQCTQQLCSAC